MFQYLNRITKYNNAIRTTRNHIGVCLSAARDLLLLQPLPLVSQAIQLMRHLRDFCTRARHMKMRAPFSLIVVGAAACVLVVLGHVRAGATRQHPPSSAAPSLVTQLSSASASVANGYSGSCSHSRLLAFHLSPELG